MSFIQREHDKLMSLCQQLPADHESYKILYAAKQALAWALEPTAFASPSLQIARHHFVPVLEEKPQCGKYEDQPSAPLPAEWIG